MIVYITKTRLVIADYWLEARGGGAYCGYKAFFFNPALAETSDQKQEEETMLDFCFKAQKP